jgi:hypothetical protein
MWSWREHRAHELLGTLSLPCAGTSEPAGALPEAKRGPASIGASSPYSPECVGGVLRNSDVPFAC